MNPLPPWTWNIPEHFNIAVACTDAHVETQGDRQAVIVHDAVHGSQSLTYAQLSSATDRVGQLLRNLGIAAGDRVLIRLPNCLEYPLIFLGAMKCAAVPVPTSILLTADEVVYLAGDSGAAALVTNRATWNELHETFEGIASLRCVILVDEGSVAAPTRLRLVNLSTAVAAIQICEAPAVTRADDPAYLVYTSGTTGYAKGVLHAHRVLLGKQPSSEYWFDFLPDGERVLHSGKYNWTYVLGTGMMDPMYRGHTTIVYEGPNDPHVWPELIARHGATTFIGVPTLYRQILQRTELGAKDVPTLRHCMSAGEHLSDELLAGWRARFDMNIYEGLGMTELSYYLCETASRPIRPGSAGFAQPGHDVHLLNPETWNEVAVNEEGMMCIPRTDPALMLGYWNQPEETERCFHGEWFLTGDYARRDEDGYIWFLGRKDDLIKSFGYRVSPHEVDRVLKEHSGVADAATVGEIIGPDKMIVVSYVVPRPDATIAPDDLVAYGRKHLATYKAPKVVYFVDDLPRTRNGKVLRRALSPQHATRHSG